jgi:hypothetical protein
MQLSYLTTGIILIDFWVRIQSRHLSKIQNGRHEQRNGQYAVARQKNMVQKIILIEITFRLHFLLATEKGLVDYVD